MAWTRLFSGQINGDTGFQRLNTIFGFKRKIPALNLSMYEYPLERVKVVKFLGVWMDEKLTWKTHTDKIICKCEKANNILRSLAGSDWGALRGTLLMIYQAMIRSMLDYGSVVFGPAANSILSKLDQVQAKALGICCGAFRTTPIPALFVEMGESPLRTRRNKLGLHYWVMWPKIQLCNKYRYIFLLMDLRTQSMGKLRLGCMWLIFRSNRASAYLIICFFFPH